MADLDLRDEGTGNMTVATGFGGRQLVSRIQYYWSGTGIGNAPSATNLPDFTVGVDESGGATGSVYHVIGGTWVDTGASVPNLYGT